MNPAGFTKTATGYTITDTSMDGWQNQSDLEVVSRWGWMLYRCPVQSIVGTTMTMQQPCFHNANLHQGEEIQNPTWLENARERLNTPGQWYLDKSTGDLYYMPKLGQDLATATSIVDNAGLQPQYQHLDPGPVISDHTAPTAAGKPAAVTKFPIVADLTWPASQDDTGVTGYSIFQDGKLASASSGPSARISGLAAGATYSFMVTARDAAGNGSLTGPPVVVTMPSGGDLALNKPVTASSYSEPNTPNLAVDGDPTTRWAQGLGLPDPSWIQVDLGAQYTVTGVITTFEKASGYEYRIEVSPDEAHWTTLDDHTSSNTTEATNYSPATQPIAGRFVRLAVTGSSYNGGSIYELQAYGNL